MNGLLEFEMCLHHFVSVSLFSGTTAPLDTSLLSFLSALDQPLLQSFRILLTDEQIFQNRLLGTIHLLESVIACKLFQQIPAGYSLHLCI